MYSLSSSLVEIVKIKFQRKSANNEFKKSSNIKLFKTKIRSSQTGGDQLTKVMPYYARLADLR